MFKKSSLKVLILIALFVAMNLVIVRFLSFQIQFPRVRISFGYVSTALCSALLGPFWGGVNALIGDVLGAVLFPKGTYFVGYTISEVLRGVIYGWFFHKKELTVKNIVLAVTTVYLVPNLLLLPFWDTLFYRFFLSNTQHTYWYFFIGKLTTYPILYGVQLGVLLVLFRSLKSFIDRNRIN